MSKEADALLGLAERELERGRQRSGGRYATQSSKDRVSLARAVKAMVVEAQDTSGGESHIITVGHAATFPEEKT